MGLVLIWVIVLAAVFCGPLLLIWSLNALFGLGIAYTFGTWVAALLLGSLVGARGAK